MKITQLQLENFRNHQQFTAQLYPKTIISGQNGSGKTSILEAIRLVSVGKSFRSSRSEDLINFDQPYCRIILEANKKKFEYFYGTQFQESLQPERRISIDGKPVNYLDFLGTLPTVAFAPKDVDIITEQPSLRRAFIDGILWQSHRQFRSDQLEYNKVLKERSQLLFLLKINRASIEELHPWNEIMVGLSDKIRLARQEFIDFANQQIQELSGTIPGKMSIRLAISSSEQSITELQDQEIKLGHNLFGPHRDDLKILADDRSARRFASRGQARTAVALLKAIEARYLKKQTETAPIILLDDLVSELDDENIEWLFNVFSDDFQLVASSVKKLAPFKGWEELAL